MNIGETFGWRWPDILASSDSVLDEIDAHGATLSR
jgi:hypothetical protein